MRSIARYLCILLFGESSKNSSEKCTRNKVVAQFGVDRFPVQRLSENEEAFTVRGRYKKPVQAVRPPSSKKTSKPRHK